MGPGSWRIIATQAAVGLSVSRILKYVDSMAKTIVGSLRDVVIVVVAPYIITATRGDSIAVGSACLVGLAALIYAVPPAVTTGQLKAAAEAAAAKRGVETQQQKDNGRSAEEGTV